MPRSRTFNPSRLTARALLLAAAMSCTSPLALAQLRSDRLYSGVNRDIPITISEPIRPGARQSLALIEPRTWREIERTGVEPGSQDLAVVLPTIWTDAQTGVRYLQLHEDGEPRGAPLVIEPLLNRPTFIDQLSARFRSALNASDPAAAFAEISALSGDQRAALADAPFPLPPRRPLLSGVRLYVDKTVMLETDFGDIQLTVLPDAAPRTAFHFLQLVEGGFYDDTVVHRVVPAAPGRPPFLIQGGDPTGTGDGGPGFSIEFEPSDVPHDFGTVSLARAEGLPNSAGSQFFICLSREAGRTLDERHSVFAQVTGGAEVVVQISQTPLQPSPVAGAGGLSDRPVTPPKIIRAVATPAPPAGTGPPPAVPAEPPPVER